MPRTTSTTSTRWRDGAAGVADRGEVAKATDRSETAIPPRSFRGRIGVCRQGDRLGRESTPSISDPWPSLFWWPTPGQSHFAPPPRSHFAISCYDSGTTRPRGPPLAVVASESGQVVRRRATLEQEQTPRHRRARTIAEPEARRGSRCNRRTPSSRSPCGPRPRHRATCPHRSRGRRTPATACGAAARARAAPSRRESARSRHRWGGGAGRNRKPRAGDVVSVVRRKPKVFATWRAARRRG